RIWPVLNAEWVVTTISAPAPRTAFRVGNVRSRVGATAPTVAVLVLVMPLVPLVWRRAPLSSACSRSRPGHETPDGHVRGAHPGLAHQVPEVHGGHGLVGAHGEP